MVEQKSVLGPVVRAMNLYELTQETLPTTTDPFHTSPHIEWWTRSYFSGSPKRLNDFISAYGISRRQLLSFLASTEIRKTTVDAPSNTQDKLLKDVDIVFEQILKKFAFGIGISGHEWLCKSFFVQAAQDARSTLNLLTNIADDPASIVDGFLQHLNQRLAQIAMPTVILEANIVRLQNTNYHSTPEDRFNTFVRDLGKRENQEIIWSKYPALLKLLATVTENCINSFFEVIERTNKNWEEIQRIFQIPKQQRLTSIIWAVGDTHCRGRSVAILTFDQTKVVYKPKGLKIYFAYASFLAWFCQVSPRLQLPTYRIIDFDNYGFVEHITAAPCSTKEELGSFFEKIGALLCVFWMLGGNDLHFENLIVAANDPHAIDLETLFDKQPQYPQNLAYQDLYIRCHRDLLFKTYILPIRVLDEHGVSDISAIGMMSSQTASVKTSKAINVGRDDIRLAPALDVIDKTQNVPRLQGVTYSPNDFVEHILRGYNIALSVFDKNKSILLSDTGPLMQFKGASTRWVPRGTYNYSSLLRSSLHPNVLRSALERDMLLGGVLTKLNQNSYLTPLIKSELHDLWQADIPYFWTTPESCSLFDSEGNEIQNFFAEDGITSFQKRLGMLASFASVHSKIIRDSLLCTTSSYNQFDNIQLSLNMPSHPTKDEFIRLARAIGDDLLTAVHYVEKAPFWFGISQLDARRYHTTILPPTLYEGSLGIGVFLGLLYQKTKEKSYYDAAVKVHKLIGLLYKNAQQISLCGAYEGFAGLIYCDLFLSSLLGRPIYAKRRALKYFIKLIKSDERLDVISGAAGALVVSLKYFIRTKNPLAFEAARAAVEKLKATYVEMDQGIAWPTIGTNDGKCLGGFAHGVSGIAWALSEWGGYTQDAQCLDLARRAISYESSLFNKEIGAWKDQRTEGAYAAAWCHGAAGIGLAAFMMKNIVGNTKCDEILEAAKAYTWKTGFNNHCLCHGALGNAELFRHTGSTQKASAFVQHALSSYANDIDWRCGHAKGIKVPGLMCGMAGIGYGLLREIDSAGIPNILLLEML